MPSFFLCTMINEPLIQKHYLDMPLSELQSRSIQLEAQRQENEGHLPRGMRTYRHRLKKALGQKTADQTAQREHYLRSQAPTINSKLSAQQLYDRGMEQGSRDGARGTRSAGNNLETPEERRGYHDGYRSAFQRGW